MYPVSEPPNEGAINLKWAQLNHPRVPASPHTLYAYILHIMMQSDRLYIPTLDRRLVHLCINILNVHRSIYIDVTYIPTTVYTVVHLYKLPMHLYITYPDL